MIEDIQGPRCGSGRAARGRGLPGLGPFEMLAELERDASSELWRARAAQGGAGNGRSGGASEFALRMLSSPDFATADGRARFQARVEHAATCKHRGLVVPCAFEWREGSALVATKWVDGLALDAWARAASRSKREVLSLFAALCEALAAAHAHGAVHGELTASSVLVDAAGRPRVLGLGLRRPLSLRTARYAAPEVVLDERAPRDARADLHALGVCLFELLTGHNPWEDVRDLELLRGRKQAQELPRPSSLHFRIGRELDVLVYRATARDPQQRYAAVQELAEDVQRLLDGRRIQAQPSPRWYLFQNLRAPRD